MSNSFFQLRGGVNVSFLCCQDMQNLIDHNREVPPARLTHRELHHVQSKKACLYNLISPLLN